MVFIGFGSEEIEHRRWTLHGEKSAHNATERASRHLCGARGLEVDMPVDKQEIDARKNEHAAQNGVEHRVVNLCEGENADG